MRFFGGFRIQVRGIFRNATLCILRDRFCNGLRSPPPRTDSERQREMRLRPAHSWRCGDLARARVAGRADSARPTRFTRIEAAFRSRIPAAERCAERRSAPKRAAARRLPSWTVNRRLAGRQLAQGR